MRQPLGPSQTAQGKGLAPHVQAALERGRAGCAVQPRLAPLAQTAPGSGLAPHVQAALERGRAGGAVQPRLAISMTRPAPAQPSRAGRNEPAPHVAAMLGSVQVKVRRSTAVPAPPAPQVPARVRRPAATGPGGAAQPMIEVKTAKTTIWILKEREATALRKLGYTVIDARTASGQPVSDVHPMTYPDRGKKSTDLRSEEDIGAMRETHASLKTVFQTLQPQLWEFPNENVDGAAVERVDLMVHCKGGCYRSPTVAGAFLIEKEGLSVEKAVAAVKAGYDEGTQQIYRWDSSKEKAVKVSAADKQALAEDPMREDLDLVYG